MTEAEARVLTRWDIDRIIGQMEARLAERRVPLRNQAGVLLTDALADPRATTGRIQVAPGQTIGSAWGNTVWDQSVNKFNTTADRDAQWASPPNGAICYTDDTGYYWRRVAGAWVPEIQSRGGYLLATTSALGAIPITFTPSLPAAPKTVFAFPAIASGSTWPNASVAVLQSSVGPTGMTAYVQKNTDGTNLATSQFRIYWGAFL